MKLTDRAVDEVEVPQGGRMDVWDDDLPGFGLRVYPSGSRSFIYRYPVPGEGRERTMVLGEAGELSVAGAREEALRIGRRVGEGADPAGPMDPSRGGFTFAQFGEIYLRRMAGRWTERTLREYERRVRTHLEPVLGATRLESVTRAQVSALLERVAESSGPYETNRIHDLIRAMFNRARSWGLFPASRPNPAHGIERFEEVPRTRWLGTDEVQNLLEAVSSQEDPYFRAFVPLILLTGLRKRDLLRVRWEDVDIERGQLEVTGSRRGRPETRRLSGPACDVLASLPRKDGNPYLFPGRQRGTHRKDFRNEWRTVREEAGLTDVTLHDLHRTAGAFMVRAGVSVRTIGDVLGHRSSAVTKVYPALADQGERERDALERLGGELAGVAPGRPGPPPRRIRRRVDAT